MRVQDGYKLIRANQLVALLAAVNERKITHRGLRVYLACQELVAIREAAERSAGKRGRAVVRRFREVEIAKLVGCTTDSPVSRELRSLRQAGLLQFADRCLDFAPQPPNNIIKSIHGGRGEGRLVPVPRKMLCFLAACNKPALAKTILAYLLRGLSLARTGEVRGGGTVKVSWICEVCQISERAARFARAELIRLGWITKDTGSVQRKLNRDGAYFQIDTSWGRVMKPFAPLREKIRARIAPPIKRPETPSDSKDQKLAAVERSGFLGEERGVVPKLRDISPEDIRKPFRLRALYDQAVRAGWLERNEASLLRFGAAAVRANRVAREPVRAFVAIVRKGLWHHISLADEDRARIVLEGRGSRGVVCGTPPVKPNPESAVPVSAAGTPQVTELLQQLSGGFLMPEALPCFDFGIGEY